MRFDSSFGGEMGSCVGQLATPKDESLSKECSNRIFCIHSHQSAFSNKKMDNPRMNEQFRQNSQKAFLKITSKSEEHSNQ